MNCLSALSFLPLSPSPLLFLGALGVARLGRRVALADAVADVADRIEPAHVLLLQEIDGIAFALGEQRDEHVGAGHFVAARRLDVEDRALDDALEAAGRRRVGRAVATLSASSSLSRYCVTVARSSSRLDAAGGHHLGRHARRRSARAADARASHIRGGARLASPSALCRVCSSSRAKEGI